MADENNTGSIAQAVETDAPAKTPTAKKQRAPRRQKAVAET
ncbi:SyrB-like regulator, partial [Agrobacterium rhizogenes]|nr:SyrB-like regulator [Rhizobium rhizogenes]